MDKLARSRTAQARTTRPAA